MRRPKMPFLHEHFGVARAEKLLRAGFDILDSRRLNYG
jgi:hypothetical protein